MASRDQTETDIIRNLVNGIFPASAKMGEGHGNVAHIVNRAVLAAVLF